MQKVKDGDDKAAIEAALKMLEDASHRAAEELYKTAASDAAPKAPEAEPKRDDTVDAEFRETKS